MQPRTPVSALAMALAVAFAATELGVDAARAQGATVWKIVTQRDQLTDRVSRIAMTLPKSEPRQEGKSVTTALIISCGSPFPNGPTHPQLTILFTPLQHMFHAAAVATRYRFDEGPIRDYKLQIPGKNGSYAVMLPKMSDQDLVAARRLRAEVYLPHTTNVLLDFNVVGAADAVKAIACQLRARPGKQSRPTPSDRPAAPGRAAGAPRPRARKRARWQGKSRRR